MDSSERIKEWLRGGNRMRWVAILGIGGILLVWASVLFERKEPTVAPPVENNTAAYAASLEDRLEEMVSSIDGAGKAAVMVMLNNGVEYIYASEEKTNTDHSENGNQVSVRDDNQKTIVTVDADSGKKGLLVTEVQPTVRGVVVACEGATDEAVSARVVQAVRTALDITEKRVCVIPYHSEKE